MPASPPSSGQDSAAQAGIAFTLLLAIMAFTPLFRAGATPLAALVSQLLGLALVSATLWSPHRIKIDRLQAATLVMLVVLPALYLLPLPAVVADWLPGRDLYREASGYLPTLPDAHSATLAVIPSAATSAVLSLVLPVSVFLGVRVLRHQQLEALVGLLIVVASLQALLGLLQYGTGQGGGTPLAVEGSHRLSAVGTYANRNHLAGLIEMVLPITLALLFYALSRLQSREHKGNAIKRSVIKLGSRSGTSVILYAAIALLLIVGVVFTRSRTGIALTILGILLTTGVFARQIGRKSALGPAGVILVLALAAGVSIGLAPVLDRFSATGLESDARWQIFNDTMIGIGAMFPVGAGPGAFPFAFPAYQSLDLGWAFINRAHNDYLEWMFDLGAAGLLLTALVLLIYLWQWGRILRTGGETRLRSIQIGCGIGVLLLGIHELVDYNLYTPANQLVFAFALSVFLYPPERLLATAARSHRRTRRTPDLLPRAQPEPMSSGPPSDQIENPFLSR
ncbi:O-antigen ligase [uncultured Thiohalocapsa sp.]|uniref:O-antigen ligase family protein n=1 Tax=uncultured Thiohalocapsa sp. TaxID=768990 RepID=UPI0025F3C4B3|nr:O-antigen ligase family protein [uncultured Thiohalocapsa sp.]